MTSTCYHRASRPRVARALCASEHNPAPGYVDENKTTAHLEVSFSLVRWARSKLVKGKDAPSNQLVNVAAAEKALTRRRRRVRSRGQMS
jgi:hypothetical protein